MILKKNDCRQTFDYGLKLTNTWLGTAKPEGQVLKQQITTMSADN